MSTATFAIVLALFEFLIGLPLLVYPAATSDWLIRLTKEPILYRLVGAVFLVLCALPLADDPRVSMDLDGLMRLVAWWGAIKCLVICWWPAGHSRGAEGCLRHKLSQRLFGAAATAFGVLLFWAGLALR